MRWTTITLATLAAIAAAGNIDYSPASAATASVAPMLMMKAAQVPADAKWVMYWNFDQAMAHPAAGKLLKMFLHSHPDAKIQIARLEKAMGVKFPEDFHDLLMVGRAFGAGHGVVVIHAHARQSHIAGYLKSDPAGTTVRALSGGVIKMVDKKGVATYEVSPVADTFVVSRSQASLRHEVQVLTGQSAGMKHADQLLAGVQPGLIVYVASTTMTPRTGQHGHRPAPAWMRQVSSLWLAASVKKEKLNVVGRVNAKSADAAAQMVQSAQGMQSMMELGATGANSNPRQRFMAGIIDRLNMGAIGKTVQIQWAMSLKKLLAGPPQKTTAGN
jgi:hypothetical protein